MSYGPYSSRSSAYVPSTMYSSRNPSSSGLYSTGYPSSHLSAASPLPYSGSHYGSGPNRLYRSRSPSNSFSYSSRPYQSANKRTSTSSKLLTPDRYLTTDVIPSVQSRAYPHSYDLTSSRSMSSIPTGSTSDDSCLRSATLETKDKSRLDGSSQSLTSTDDDRSATPLSVEYNEDNLDYKRLYEEVKAENELLKLKLRKTEAALKETREQLDKALMSHRNSMSDAEKRERRALERKLSEMEEELKKVNNLKVSNDKLREENGALERVANKLSQ